jgi:ParB/RepB/Spo0J family partition protein
LRRDLRPDPHQPRKEFDKDKLQELADSFKTNGIQQDLTVRPDPDGKGKFLIVDGERRWRAAALAGVDRLPIAVRELTDEEARRYQLIAGTQRENLSALDEANALNGQLTQRRLKDPKFSLELLADELGIKRSTAYNRLALVKLAAPVKAAFLSGKIDASKAQIIGSVAPGLQEKLLKEVRGGYETMSVRRLQELVKEDYQRSLKAAPFDLADAKLYPSAGACLTCPKRSGNLKLAGDPNVCTDPPCFEKKCATANAARLAEARAKGARVLSPEAYDRGRYSEYRPASEKNYNDAKGRSFATLARVAGIQPILTVDDENKLVEVLSTEDRAEINKKVGIRSSSGNARDNASRRQRQKKEKLYRRAAELATEQILKKLVTEKGMELKLWAFVAAGAYAATDISVHDFVAKRRGLSKTIIESRGALTQWLKTNVGWLDFARMTVELLACARWGGNGWHEVTWSKTFKELCALAGVKLERLLKTAAGPAGSLKKGKGAKK